MIYTLDERAKLAGAFLTMIASLACIQWECQLTLLAASLLLCLACRAVAEVLVFTAAVALLAAGIFSYHWITGSRTLSGIGIVFLVLKFGPMCAMILFLYKTVDTTLLLRAMAKMRAPAAILLPLGVTLRFMPSFIREFSHVRDALAFRGIILSPGTFLTQPFRVMESVLIPLLMRSVFIGEELSRAAMARGIDAPGRQVSIHEIRFKFKDMVWTGSWAAGTCVLFCLDWQMGGI